jgi:hypothetical protein
MVMAGGTVLLVLAAALAQAQDRGQGRGGFGYGGPGGGNVSLLGMAEVQKEIAISDDQKKLLDDLQADLRDQFRTAFGDFQNLSEEERRKRFEDFQKMSEEERRKQMDEFRKKGEEVTKKADEMLGMILDEKQLDRLSQLRLQREGVDSLSRDEVAKKLGLSEAQRAKLKKIQDDARSADQDFFRNMRNLSDEERREAFTKMREQRDKRRADLLAVLSDAQKESWEKMQGKKFEFPPPRGFGPGGPGGDGVRQRPESKKKSG